MSPAPARPPSVLIAALATRSRAYASASPAQVVLWWLYALLTRLVPLPRAPLLLHPAMVGAGRRSYARVGYAGWLAVGAAVLWAQLGLWRTGGVAPEGRG